MNITPHVNCVTTLPCKIKMPEKITITDSKCLVNKIHFQPKMHDVRCYTLLYPFLWPIVIWRIELYVCFWPLLFSKPTISSTMITFSSVRVCFSLPISCRWLVLHLSKISVNKIPTFSLLQFILKNSATILQKLYFWNRYKFLIRVLSPLLNGTLHHRYTVSTLKIIIYDNIICFCLQHQKCT